MSILILFIVRDKPIQMKRINLAASGECILITLCIMCGFRCGSLHVTYFILALLGKISMQ